MGKLIPLDEFIFDCHEKCISNNGRTYNYAKFLKQPLKLEMFIPCDEYDVPLDEPNYYGKSIETFREQLNYFNEAKERVLFEGFEVLHRDKVRITIQKNFFQLDYNTMKECFENYNFIEDLVNRDLTLTKSAIDKHEL